MALPSPHILLLPYPVPGHINPLLNLAKLLAAQGFVVSFVTSNWNVRKMLTTKQELDKQGIKLLGISDGLESETDKFESVLQPSDFVASVMSMHTSFDELVGKMVKEQGLGAITCIISDSLVLWSQDVANKWGIPRIAFWTSSLTTFACIISVPKIMAASPHLDPFKAQVYENGAGEHLRCIPGISEIDMRMLPFYLGPDGDQSKEQWLRHTFQSLMERVNEALCIIYNSFPDLEKEVHTHLKELLPCTPTFTLGPFCLLEQSAGETATGDNDECMWWLDTQQPRSVIYISLGSVVVLHETEIQEIALGLEASKQPFLWVLRSAPCELALKWFSKEGNKRGKVISWAPQVKVLSHEAVGGFLTHCGWNSTLESVSNGVPLIAWPHLMDQLTNCWFLVEKEKVAIRLEVEEGGRVGRKGVEKGIRRLMQEDEGRLLRARASTLTSRAHSALTTSLPSQLDSLVQCILSSSPAQT